MANIRISSVNERETGRNWNGLVFLLLVIFVVLLVIFSVFSWMNDETQMPLSKIAVEGDLYFLSSAEVRDAVNKLGSLESFMSQNVDSIQNAVVALPWVERVSVRKQWPDTIKINVTEHEPVAIWRDNKLLNEEGVVFNASPNEVKNKKLISLNGPKGSEKEVLEAWLELSEILRKTGLEIAELILNERRSWRILTTNHIRIELGLESRTERLKRFVALFDEIKVKRLAIDYVDLRYDTGVAVGWKPKKNKSALNQE